jgi:hypothetical protein
MVNNPVDTSRAGVFLFLARPLYSNTRRNNFRYIAGEVILAI